ncbi:MAG: extracellular solute-binding protein [Thermoleophilia bacterium]
MKAGIVDAGWASGPTKGMVTDSVVKPSWCAPATLKNIHTPIWCGQEVLTPNVFTRAAPSGTPWLRTGRDQARQDPAQARQYLADLYSHVSVQDKSAREALQTFTAGKGDVLLSYEDEAILAEKSGQKVTHVVPDQTLLIENPIAVTKNSKHAAQAKAFVDYAESAAGQAVFGAAGYRPVLPAVAAKFNFPTPKTLFTIADLGGWDTVNTTFFDPDNGVVAKIFKDRGISVGN